MAEVRNLKVVIRAIALQGKPKRSCAFRGFSKETAMRSMSDIGRQFFGIVLGGACLLRASCATAQIIPDGTLPNNSNVTVNGSVFNITGGSQAD